MGTDSNADDAVVVVPLDVEAVTVVAIDVVAIMVTVAMMKHVTHQHRTKVRT